DRRVANAVQRLAARQLLRRDVAELQQQALGTAEPFFVVRSAQVVCRRHPLAGVARHVDVPPARPGGERQRESAALPIMVEHRFVRLGRDRAHAVHASHVVHAVHRLGASTFATPIIASRVTSWASCSSVMPSVPAGRSGMTRERSSAGLSQTRTSTSSESTTPNSRSTPRGSMTARDRYGADLYQTGGSPSTGHG